MSSQSFEPVYPSPVEDWLADIAEAIGDSLTERQRTGIVEVLRAAYGQGWKDRSAG